MTPVYWFTTTISSHFCRWGIQAGLAGFHARISQGQCQGVARLGFIWSSGETLPAGLFRCWQNSTPVVAGPKVQVLAGCWLRLMQSGLPLVPHSPCLSQAWHPSDSLKLEKTLPLWRLPRSWWDHLSPYPMVNCAILHLCRRGSSPPPGSQGSGCDLGSRFQRLAHRRQGWVNPFPRDTHHQQVHWGLCQKWAPRLLSSPWG